MQVSEKVIILRTVKYGESDLVVQALNSKGAKLSLFARGALRSKKRFGGGVLEPTHYVHVVYDEKLGKGLDAPLHTLKEAALLEGFDGLRTDYTRLEIALKCVQLVSDVSREGETDTSLFNLLGHTLRALQTSRSLEKLRTQFEVKLLTYQGVLPHEITENVLARTPVSEHESLELTDRDWQDVQMRTRRVLREYLDHLPHHR